MILLQINKFLLSSNCRISHHKINTVADMMVLFSTQRLEVKPLIVNK